MRRSRYQLMIYNILAGMAEVWWWSAVSDLVSDLELCRLSQKGMPNAKNLSWKAPRLRQTRLRSP
jgi:hypothetical protein